MKWLARLEALFAATAFAEEGDAETARRLMADEAEPPPQEERARPAPRAGTAGAPHVGPARGRARLG